jgi:TolA-binding protein
MKTIYSIFLIIAFFAIAAAACSPVRSSAVGKAPKKSPQSAELLAAEENKPRPRFADTTVVDLPPVTVATALDDNKIVRNLDKEFSQAVKLFDQKKYDTACDKFTQYRETLDPKDSLYFEAIFYISECLVVQNKFPDAERNLLLLYNSGLTPDTIFEKTLIRLGHINCALKREQKASVFFKELGDKYPSSIYLPLADCVFIKGGN